MMIMSVAHIMVVESQWSELYGDNLKSIQFVSDQKL